MPPLPSRRPCVIPSSPRLQCPPFPSRRPHYLPSLTLHFPSRRPRDIPSPSPPLRRLSSLSAHYTPRRLRSFSETPSSAPFVPPLPSLFSSPSRSPSRRPCNFPSHPVAYFISFRSRPPLPSASRSRSSLPSQSRSRAPVFASPPRSRSPLPSRSLSPPLFSSRSLSPPLSPSRSLSPPLFSSHSLSPPLSTSRSLSLSRTHEASLPFVIVSSHPLPVASLSPIPFRRPHLLPYLPVFLVFSNALRHPSSLPCHPVASSGSSIPITLFLFIRITLPIIISPRFFFIPPFPVIAPLTGPKSKAAHC
ncbi:unnamed protein product [Closterium sp. NIES-65]|nr:unnamed protein product [Closterium sp. NIES-65]